MHFGNLVIASLGEAYKPFVESCFACNCIQYEDDIRRGLAYIRLTIKQKGRALHKFGEWDVNNPAAAEGFPVIFNKARDEKKSKGSAPNIMPSASSKKNQPPPSPPTPKSKWFCCVGV
ncbi:oxygen-independent coproporphyrinogen-III oxidase-like protein [Gossypium australe]|uniref:Oxygen-independent coproporphyrinogen-III oxidase-like protein n=1 Tax=Gossypium australe TaxID=47621 RepID=A0A5B6U8P7_9ROSI|nr:oxygen-independent coproporphyrinogen-III oxidase-like protein [Gossypium australe]